MLPDMKATAAQIEARSIELITLLAGAVTAICAVSFFGSSLLP